VLPRVAAAADLPLSVIADTMMLPMSITFSVIFATCSR
jgi:uncharacterized protein YceK